MSTNIHGVYEYTEADSAATASALLNKQSAALTKINTPVIVDVGAVLTLAAGWSTSGGSMVRMGHHRQLTFEAKRTGAPITVPATGNIANSVIGTLTVPADRPLKIAPLGSGLSGRSVSGGIRDTGEVEIGAVGGSTAFATDEQVQIVAVWISAGVVA